MKRLKMQLKTRLFIHWTAVLRFAAENTEELFSMNFLKNFSRFILDKSTNMRCNIYYIIEIFYDKKQLSISSKFKIMKTKIRKISDWKSWQITKTKHNAEIIATHIAVIIAVFIFAACL